MTFRQAPSPCTPFEDVLFSETERGWEVEFVYRNERHTLFAAERTSLEQRLSAMQLAMYTVPADQWREIRQGGLASYKLPRADGSGFVVTHDGTGLPFCDANKFPVSTPEVPRAEAWKKMIVEKLHGLLAPGCEPPMLAA